MQPPLLPQYTLRLAPSAASRPRLNTRCTSLFSNHPSQPPRPLSLHRAAGAASSTGSRRSTRRASSGPRGRRLGSTAAAVVEHLCCSCLVHGGVRAAGRHDALDAHTGALLTTACQRRRGCSTAGRPRAPPVLAVALLPAGNRRACSPTQAVLMMFNGVAILNNDRFLEKCEQQAGERSAAAAAAAGAPAPCTRAAAHGPPTIMPASHTHHARMHATHMQMAGAFLR